MKKMFLGVSLVVLCDIIIKLIISFNFTLNKSIELIPDFFYLTYTHNDGAAWSILSGKTFLLIIISFFVIIGLIYFVYKNKPTDKITAIGYILLLGGAIGNLIDRMIYGYVIDYLDFYIFNYHFPIFNLADSCIVIGVILYLIGGKK